MASALFDTEIENENMFEIELEQNENKNEKLPTELFQELETELLDSLLHKENNNDLSDDETDGPIDFIRQIVDNVREEFNGVFKQYGFWTFSKDIKCWNVYDPQWCKRNKNFTLLLIKEY